MDFKDPGRYIPIITNDPGLHSLRARKQSSGFRLKGLGFWV